jgi:ABC-type multidrug transport system ATPase subunit
MVFYAQNEVMSMTEAIVETHGLTRRYGRATAVDRVDLCVPRGSIYGFLGPNGAGKTTVIRMLLGLIRPTAGTIRLFGQDLAKHRLQVLRRVGSLVESPSYYGHLTGYENLAVVATLLDVPKRRIDEVLELVCLTSAAHRKVRGYSLGMKQRLGIAAALLGNPELLILDEPTNGLDPAGIQEIRRLLTSLPSELGVAVVVSSHLLAEVEHVATHVGIIHRGQLRFQGDIEELRRKSTPKLCVSVDHPEAAADVLRRAGFSVRVCEDGVELPDEGLERTALVNRILVSADRDVYRLATEQPSLEELFLQHIEIGESL